MLMKKTQSTRQFTKANTTISVLQDAKKLLKHTHKNILGSHEPSCATHAAEDHNLEDCEKDFRNTALPKFRRKKTKA